MPGLDAYGTTFERGDGGDPEVFTALANVGDISGPETERKTIEVSSHDSPDQWGEFVGGFKNGGQVSLQLNYDPRVHDVIYADYDDDQPRSYRITWPNGLGQWDFRAVMTGFAPSAPVQDKLAATVTFQVSGKPVLS